MTLLLLAVLPSVVALTLLIALGVAVVWRTVLGERWQVPLERTGAGLSAASVQGTERVTAALPTAHVVLAPIAVPSAS